MGILPLRRLLPVEVHPLDIPPSQVGKEGLIRQAHVTVVQTGRFSSPACDLGQEAMALLSVFGPNSVPKVMDKQQPADGKIEV